MPNNPPQVSILLPTYNRLSYLPRAVNSVFNQTYQDWELIIWDDGSTDETGGYCQTLQDPRIQYFWHENRGVAFARNQAIGHASGEYLAFLDSDDEWLPEKLSIQVDFLDQYPDLDLVFSNFHNVNLELRKSSVAFTEISASLEKLVTETVDDILLINGNFLESIAHENYIATDSVMMRKSVLDEFGGFNGTLRNGEDFELWWRLGLAGVRMGYTDSVLINRFKAADNLSGQSIESSNSAIKALDICAENAYLAKREDLISDLRKPYRNAWQNLILLYGREGRTNEMIKAFRESLRFGFQPGSIRLLIAGLLGL